jgi:hypothetical protein
VALRIYDYRWSSILVDSLQIANSSAAPCILTENDKKRVKSSVIKFYSEELSRQGQLRDRDLLDGHMGKSVHGLVQQCVW